MFKSLKVCYTTSKVRVFNLKTASFSLEIGHLTSHNKHYRKLTHKKAAAPGTHRFQVLQLLWFCYYFFIESMFFCTAYDYARQIHAIQKRTPMDACLYVYAFCKCSCCNALISSIDNLVSSAILFNG